MGCLVLLSRLDDNFSGPLVQIKGPQCLESPSAAANTICCQFEDASHHSQQVATSLCRGRARLEGPQDRLCSGRPPKHGAGTWQKSASSRGSRAVGAFELWPKKCSFGILTRQ